MSHTPGPWHVMWGGPGVTRGRVATIYATDEQELRYLAHVPVDPTHAEHEPTPSDYNAVLIAAAPDLLEALEGLIARLDSDGPIDFTDVDQARAAVRKARGAS